MPLPPFLAKIFLNKGSEVATDILSGLDGLFTSKEEKLQKQIEIQEVINKHFIAVGQLAQQETDSYLKDMDSARVMQIEALKQNDLFAKRFIYYFTIFLTACTFLFDFCLFWVQYPERNHDLINVICGTLNTGCLVSIINFFYGSSKSSEKKQDTIDKITHGK